MLRKSQISSTDFIEKTKKHKVGVNGWTVEDHLAYRQSYAPDILQDLLEKLEEISSRKDLLPKSTLAQAVGYALNEYNAICDIFKRGDTALDNNYIERIQRYISLSRRNSMFFGSHEGASRAAILYSIAISCRLNGINLFEYICDVIEKTAEWQPNTPLEKYRDLLPDRWKKQQQHLFNQLLLFFLNYARYKRGDAYMEFMILP